ncbi:MAG: L-threonylcarbamoyladenylate synthase [Dehalococcoidia bacterium]|nr:L-threonylcarbamoyladenylate synthase [Dehalococcoidia bacterium]
MEHLRRGEPLVFPTDTVYGLGAHCYIESAVRQIYRIKGRPANKPIALLLADPQDVLTVAREVPDVAWRLIEQFFPGALTLVLPKDPAVPYWITAGGEGVAVRVPDHPFARSLIRGLGVPLATTSANLAGHPAPVTAQDAYAQLGAMITLVLDGGPCPGGRESTVLDLTGPDPLLLREGAIPREALEEVVEQRLVP